MKILDKKRCLEKYKQYETLFHILPMEPIPMKHGEDRWMSTGPRLYYLNSRFYDPEVKRFLSSDVYAVVFAATNGITDKNLYNYCDNNPVMRADDSGHFWHVVIGAVVGGGMELAGQLMSGKSLKEVNWAKVGVSALSGGVSAAVPGGFITAAVIGGTTDVAFDMIDGNINSVGDAAKSFAWGAAKEVVSQGVGKALDKGIGKLAGKFAGKTSYGKSSGNDSNLEKIINIMKSGEKTLDGKNIISQLDETTKVIFRMDVGDNAHKILSKGYTEPVNHINIEIQKLGHNGSYKPKWDYHIVLDEFGKVIDSFPLGVWTK